MGCEVWIAGERPVLVQAEMGARNDYRKWQAKAAPGFWMSDEKENNSTEASCNIKHNESKLIQIIDMACLSDQNINEKVKKNLQKYQQLAYEIKDTMSRYSQ